MRISEATFAQLKELKEQCEAERRKAGSTASGTLCGTWCRGFEKAVSAGIKHDDLPGLERLVGLCPNQTLNKSVERAIQQVRNKLANVQKRRTPGAIAMSAIPPSEVIASA